jgi:hypothetical protein
MATNQVQRRADTAIGFGAADVKEHVHPTLTWLKAFGVGVVAISGQDSQEYWRRSPIRRSSTACRPRCGMNRG